MGLTLTSTSFQADNTIPQQFTCKGQDISPALSWTHVPENTQSFVLIMNDPDAPNGNWVHWILFNIPADASNLAENATQGTSGLNSWNKSGYGGPCPPNGTHRYIFKLYALDTVLHLENNAQYEDVIQAMQQHIIEETSLMGTFG